MGARLAQKLRESSAAVRVLGLSPTEADDRLRQAGVEIFYGDVTRPEDVETSMRGVDIVYHLAAVLSSPEDPARYHAVNVLGTQNVLEAAERAGARHFIFVSSISVLYPRRNAYSASKAEAEERVHRSRTPWTIARPCLVWGGAEHQAFARAVARWPVLFLPRGGAARKRPLSAGELAEGLARLAGAGPGKTVALCGSEIVSLRDMAESILRARGSRKPVRSVPEGWLRAAAALTEPLSRLFGRRFSWISHQSVDGLVYDAAPERDPQ